MAEKTKELYLLAYNTGRSVEIGYISEILSQEYESYELDDMKVSSEDESFWYQVSEYLGDDVEIAFDNDSFGYEYGSISGTHGGGYAYAESNLILKIATLYHDLPPDFVSFSGRVQGYGVDLTLQDLKVETKQFKGHKLRLWTLTYDVEMNGC